MHNHYHVPVYFDRVVLQGQWLCWVENVVDTLI